MILMVFSSLNIPMILTRAPHLMEEVGDCQVVVVEENLLLCSEEPFPDGQARPRHRGGVVLHVEFVGEFVGRQFAHWKKHRTGKWLPAPPAVAAARQDQEPALPQGSFLPSLIKSSFSSTPTSTAADSEPHRSPAIASVV